MVIVLTCHCGAYVEYDNPTQGSIDVGRAKNVTGWEYSSCTFTGNAVWVCPSCATKLKKIAMSIFKLSGTPYLYICGFLPRTVRDEWIDKHMD